MEKEEWRLREEEVSKLEEAEDVAFKDYDVFTVTAEATKDAAEKTITTTDELLGLQEEEES